MEGDDDGRDIDDFEPAEVEENTADSEEDGEVARDRSPLRGLGREGVSREKETR